MREELREYKVEVVVDKKPAAAPLLSEVELPLLAKESNHQL